MVEKRAFTRFKKTYPATLKIEGSESALPCQTIDISRTGIALKLKESLPKSSTTSLHLNSIPEYPSITTKAQPVWSKPLSRGNFYYGLRFTELEEDSLLTLRRLLGYEVDHIVTASYLPERIVTNEDIVKMGFPGAAITLERGLGAKERRAAAKGETNADMLARVGKAILQKAGLSPDELDRIICSAVPEDAVAPDTSSIVQWKLGASCPAFVVSMSCTGWIAGVDLALRCLATGEKRILVLASSIVGSGLRFYNLMHRAIFGDGAGGILIESHHLKQFLARGLWTDGQYYSKIFVPFAWSTTPEDFPAEYKDSFYMSDNQQVFFRGMDSYLSDFVNKIFRQTEVSPEDIDLFLLHYPAKPLFEHSLKVFPFPIPRSKILFNFERYGNIVPAEMPVLLDEAISTGRIKKGSLVFMLTYGAGFTAGSLIIRY
jgi:3-oxoacyl-[acyl-carrier-protein] synthase-3